MAPLLILLSLSLWVRSVSANSASEPAVESNVATEESEEAGSSEGPAGGIELGEFRIRCYYPVEAQKCTMKFVLHAEAPGERLGEMQEIVETHRNKLRDQIITAARMVPLSVFDEPDLASFRRRILVRLRRALPELEIENLYVSDFNLAIKSL
jgi:hypothetical protein